MDTRKSMPLWTLRYTWNKATFCPGEQANLSISIQNTCGNPIFINTVKLRMDWDSKVFVLPCNIHIPAHDQSSIPLPSVIIPANITGRIKVHCVIETYAYQNKTGQWIDYGFVKPKGVIVLNIKPGSVYRAFISRSNWDKDRPLIDPIVKKVSEWGFEPHTVGINVRTRNPNDPSPEIQREIAEADCLIAIATPRDFLVKHGMWTAPDWLHGEVGIGFGKEKPIFVIYEESIRLAGLPQHCYHIAFSMNNLQQLLRNIDALMPYIRKWIEKRKWDALWSNVFTGLTVGILGYGIYKAGEEEGRKNADA